MKLTNVYTKKFSKILNLQAEEEISYYLVTLNEHNLYGILVKYSDDYKNDKVLSTKFKSKEEALEIIKFFYENSIRPEESEDILQNLKYLKECY